MNIKDALKKIPLPLDKAPRIRIKSTRQLVLYALIFQTVLGGLFALYGILYTRIDEQKAGEMLEFIRETNPSYYQNLVTEENHAYRRDFYNHFKVRGNRGYLLFGLFFLVVSGHIAIAGVVMVFMGPKPEEQEESGDGEESQNEGEGKGGKEDASAEEEEDTELF